MKKDFVWIWTKRRNERKMSVGRKESDLHLAVGEIEPRTLMYRMSLLRTISIFFFYYSKKYMTFGWTQCNIIPDWKSKFQKFIFASSIPSWDVHFIYWLLICNRKPSHLLNNKVQYILCTKYFKDITHTCVITRTWALLSCMPQYFPICLAVCNGCPSCLFLPSPCLYHGK